ncbi:hypothetical protein HY492_02005 [Candidatus Woesearchaeota archaeon]|nr:hypothetical protein [Candidatus Woesearchaeota archaeon]
MLERLLLATAIGCSSISGCTAPQKIEYTTEVPTKDIAEKTVDYLATGKPDEAMSYLDRYDRKSATMSYLRAITTVAKSGPPDATNFLAYISAGNHFEEFFNYVSQSPSLIERVQDEIPDRLFELSLYQDGKKGLRSFVRNPGKLWWWHVLSKNNQKLTLSNCYATLPAMEIVEGNYGNCARALKIGKPHFLPGRRDRMKEAIDNWFVYLVRESAALQTDDPQRIALEVKIKDVEALQKALEQPPYKATLQVIAPPK